jgi:carboxypeptidase C (cathepsin A)
MTDSTDSEARAGTTATGKDSDRNADPNTRLRELVDRRLAQPAARSDGVLARRDAPDLHYEAIAEYLPVLAGTFDSRPEEPQAAVFTIAYLADAAGEGGAPAPVRPVCFAFNGGPGSSSIWLHLGALGPKRVPMNEDGTMPPPPYAVTDNPLSWLSFFDLVFVDPPHTGTSITASEEARKKMLSVDGDVDALAEVIRGWLARHQRFGASIYLVGESYGTTRGAALADKLLDLGIALSGLVLVSCAMDLQALDFVPGNDLPFALFLPAFACAAQYHGKLAGALGASPAAARQAAEAFVVEDYLVALHRGATLGSDARRRVGARLAALTGLPLALVEQKNLRIRDATFFTHLLRDEGKLVGRLESRVAGPLGASRSHDWEFDPGLEALGPPYSMAAQAYFADALGLRNSQRYEIISGDVHKKWNWNRGEQLGNGFTTTSLDLARALRRNPHLRVLVASGYYDLGTPYSATDYSLAQLDIPAEVALRITHHYFDAGHMMYTRPGDLTKLHADLSAWLDPETLAPRSPALNLRGRIDP